MLEGLTSKEVRLRAKELKISPTALQPYRAWPVVRLPGVPFYIYFQHNRKSIASEEDKG